MSMMTKVKLDEIGTVRAYGQEQRFMLADGVQVFLLADSMYVPADLDILNNMENHTIYGYYDEDFHGEGAIRVITAIRE